MYCVDDEFLTRLDHFEGHPHLYQRDVITVSVTSHRDNTTPSSRAEKKQEIVKCCAYLRKHFDQALLDKETFASYDSLGPHRQPYRPE